MLCEKELNEFFAHVDEISQTSQDSVVLNHFNPPIKSDGACVDCQKLKAKLHKASKSAREVLQIYQNEREVKEIALRELEEIKLAKSEAQKLIDELQKENVNQQFGLKENYNDMEEKYKELTEKCMELSKDYLDVLSDATLNYCFEVGQTRAKLVRDTEYFLRAQLGENFEKPKIITRRVAKKKEDPTPAKRGRKCKKQPEKVVEVKESKRKRRKIETFDDMQSISQVTSPASFYEDETDDVDSSFTFNTFSIGNETTYSLVEMQKNSQKSQICTCNDEKLDLVSIGVNTEEIDDSPLPSVPVLGEINLDCNEIATSTHEDIQQEPIEVPVQNSTSIGINTEILTANKSTSTVHSTTTRGTCTPQMVSKNFASQFPEIIYEKIFAETIFELPDCISPIFDIDFEEPPKETSTATQTNLSNVCRDIDYVVKDADDFSLLGKSIFNIFLEHLKKSNKSLVDEETARERLISYMQQKFFDRFEELTFDDYFNPSFLHEREREICDKENYEATVESSEDNFKDVKVDSNEKISIELEQTRECIEILENVKIMPSDVIEEIPEVPETQVQRKSLMDELFGDDLSDDPIEDLNSDERSPSPASIYDETDSSSSDDESEHELSISSDTSSESSEDEIDFDSPMSPAAEDRGFEGEFYIETPKSPPPFAQGSESFKPLEVPLENSMGALNSHAFENPLEYQHKIRQRLVQWQQRHAISTKESDKMLCKIRKSIHTYLNSEWSNENLEICLNQLKNRNEKILLEAIFETVEDNSLETEISLEFTPPAPPLPQYQQKLILLIKKLAESNAKLPHMLIDDLEMKLFKCDNKADMGYLKNMTYYYTSLIDLFFEGNSTMILHFMVKCIYFHTYKAIPMIFVLIKAFPQALPKKSVLLKKHSKNIDWENMTGLQLSKVRVDLEWIDSLELTIIYLLTSIQLYRKKNHECNTVSDHEIFNYFPKFYGFPVNFLTAPKLLDILMKRLEDGETTNLSLSFILLAKRTNADFTVRTLVKGKLVPLLHKSINEITESIESTKIDQICILIDVISSVLKALPEEKNKSFNDLFPLLIHTLGRAEKCQKIQECCIRAILRLQRFVTNHKEIYDILTKHYEKQNSFSESLRLSIITFIHRKNEVFFKK